MKMTIKKTSALTVAALAGTLVTGTVEAEEVKDVTAGNAPVLVDQAAKEITKAEVDTAKANLDVAKADVEAKKTDVATASQAVTSAQKDVATAKEKVALAENAPAEVAKVETSIEAKTAEKAALDTQVADAKANLAEKESQANATKLAKDTADTAVANAQKAVDAAQVALGSESSKLAKQIEAKELELKNARSSFLIDFNEKKLAEAKEKQKSVQAALEAELNSQPKTTYKANPADEVERDVEADRERVNYNGTRVEEVPEFNGTYIMNRKKVEEYFMQYLDELRELNGIPKMFETATDSEFQRKGQVRAEEAVENYSHYSKSNSRGFAENLARSMARENEPMSDKELAYKFLLAWYSDYHNIDWDSDRPYGHRENLLYTDVNVLLGRDLFQAVLGIHEDKESKYFRYYTGAFNLYQIPIDFEVEDEAFYSMSASERSKYIAEYNKRMKELEKYQFETTIDEQGVKRHTMNGKKLLFLPKITFNYVNHIISATPNTAREQELRSQLSEYESDERVARNRLAELYAESEPLARDLQALKAEQARLTADKADKIAKLAEAQSTLNTAKMTQVTAGLAYNEAKAKADTAKAELAQLEAKVKATSAEISQLEAKKAEIEGLAGKVAELKAAVVVAEGKVLAARVAKVEAEKLLEEAESKLEEVRKEYDQLARDYELQELLKRPKDVAQKEPKVTEPKVNKPNGNVKIGSVSKNISVQATNNKTTETKALSRVEKYHQQLPKTGTVSSVALQAFGAGLTALGLVGYCRKRKSRYAIDK